MLLSRLIPATEDRQPKGRNHAVAPSPRDFPIQGDLVRGQRNGTDCPPCRFRTDEKAIFDGTIKTVIVWKLDRISRRLQDGINLIADWCERGVRVVSITQQIDLSGPVGRMVASVMFGLAENRTGVSPRAPTRRNRCGQNSRDLSRQASLSISPHLRWFITNRC